MLAAALLGECFDGFAGDDEFVVSLLCGFGTMALFKSLQFKEVPDREHLIRAISSN